MWEKEIRRARKDTFKSQSVIVKLQEELKAVRTQLRKSQSAVDDEKERSNKREQEAFEARYQLVGLQEELTALMEKVKLVEQERDALKTIAKNEEVARIAAEGQLPLPKLSADDEFASPRKASAPLRRVSIMSSLASEEEIDHLKQSLEWERQRADRAFALVDYMNVECQFKCCSCKVSESTSKRHNSPSPRGTETITQEPSTMQTESTTADELDDDSNPTDLSQPRTIFIPSEGIFRTISPAVPISPRISPTKASLPAPAPSFSQSDELLISLQSPVRLSFHARTPSCEPPTTAILPENTSLLSLLDAPPSPAASEATVVRHQVPSRQESLENSIFNHSIHTAADPVLPANAARESFKHQTHQSGDPIVVHENNPDFSHHLHSSMDQAVETSSPAPTPPLHTTFPAPQPEPHFHTISTTTRIPLALPSDDDDTSLIPSTRPANILPASLDSALSPTMTREEALAMIRERRGRARSLHQAQVAGIMTPKKGRDISAPGVVGGMATGPRSARSISRGRLNRV